MLALDVVVREAVLVDEGTPEVTADVVVAGLNKQCQRMCTINTRCFEGGGSISKRCGKLRAVSSASADAWW